MAQPQRHARLDVHGNPLPELAEARQEVLLHSPNNQERRRLLHSIVDRVCQEYLRRGENVEVTLRFIIADGTIQEQMVEGLMRRYGTGSGWRHTL